MVAAFAQTAEAIVRGHRAGLLTIADYNNLSQCETLEDIKLNLVRVLASNQLVALALA